MYNLYTPLGNSVEPIKNESFLPGFHLAFGTEIHCDIRTLCCILCVGTKKLLMIINIYFD